MPRSCEEDFEESSSGPTTRRIHYVPRDGRELHAAAGFTPPITQSDHRNDAERARQRLGLAVVAFRDTVRHTVRDLVLAARGISTCAGRWIVAEREQRATSQGSDGRSRRI